MKAKPIIFHSCTSTATYGGGIFWPAFPRRPLNNIGQDASQTRDRQNGSGVSQWTPQKSSQQAQQGVSADVRRTQRAIPQVDVLHVVCVIMFSRSCLVSICGIIEWTVLSSLRSKRRVGYLNHEILKKILVEITYDFHNVCISYPLYPFQVERKISMKKGADQRDIHSVNLIR